MGQDFPAADGPAVVALLFTHNPKSQFLAFDFCILVFVFSDTARHRRLHPAFHLLSFRNPYRLGQRCISLELEHCLTKLA
jgi:hypothetical protein